MRYHLWFLALSLLFLAGCSPTRSLAPSTRFSDAPPEDLRVMTFNIRVQTASDGEHQWQFRRNAVAGMLGQQHADVLGFQEVSKPQLDDLQADLPAYTRIGVSRLGNDQSEFCPIFYRTARFEVLASGTFWISPTPDTPASKGWDGVFPRIATWAKLRKSTCRELLVMNTHLDHKGKTARREGAILLKRRLTELAGPAPAILMGDFNSYPTSEAYQTLTTGELALRDARLCSRDGHLGPVETFSGVQHQVRSLRLHPRQLQAHHPPDSHHRPPLARPATLRPPPPHRRPQILNPPSLCPLCVSVPLWWVFVSLQSAHGIDPDSPEEMARQYNIGHLQATSSSASPAANAAHRGKPEGLGLLQKTAE